MSRYSRYEVTDEAHYDIQEIWSFIAANSLDAADRHIRKLYGQFTLLAENPQIGHTRKDLTESGILFWPVGDYLILYRALPNCIEILAVTQGNRDIPSLLRQRSL